MAELIQDEIIIGIDLGTTNSVVAVVTEGEPRVLLNAEGKARTPSVVAFVDEGGEDGSGALVGEVALRQIVTNPERTITAVKRLMGHFYTEILEKGERFAYKVVPDDNGKVLVDIDGTGYTPQQISSLILAKLKEAAEDAFGGEVTKAIVTVPAYFDDLQRQATIEAAEMAGLEVMRLVNEPTAAAMAFGLGRNFDGIAAVYDFGGGTFDISILEIQRNSYEVLTTTGDSRLGGEDIDLALLNYIADAFLREHNIDLRDQPMSFRRLKDAAEQAKCELSTTQQTRLSLPFVAQKNGGPLHLEITLQRGELEDLIEPLVKRTLDCCQRAMKEAGLRRSRIDRVILVGGSTRIPLVQEKVEAFFNQDLFKGVNPDEIVALGAATQGSVLAGQLDDVVLMEVTPHSLGIEIKDGRFSRIIEKNSTIPLKASKAFTTTEDFQEFVNIHVLQGEDEYVQNNRSLGKFTLSGINSMKSGIPRIEVAFFINADGIVEIAATDVLSGKGESLTVHHSFLTEEEQREIKKAGAAIQRKGATSERKKRKEASYQVQGRKLESDGAEPLAPAARVKRLPADAPKEIVADAPVAGAAFQEVLSSTSAREVMAALDGSPLAVATAPDETPVAMAAKDASLARAKVRDDAAAERAAQTPAEPAEEYVPGQDADNPLAMTEAPDDPFTRPKTPLPAAPFATDAPLEADAPPAPPAAPFVSRLAEELSELPEAVARAEQLMARAELTEADRDALRQTLPDYQALAKAHPGSFVIGHGIVQLQAAIQDPQEALTALEALEENTAGRDAEILELASWLLERFPRFVPALKYRAALLEKAGQADRALEDYEQALALTASDAELMRKLQKIYEQKLKEKAEPAIQFNLIKIHLKRNEIDQAIAILQHLVKESAYAQRATKILGLCFWQKHMYYLAYQKFRSLPVNEEMKDILYRLATDMEAADQLTNARYSLERVIEVDIDYRDVKERIESIDHRIKQQQETSGPDNLSQQPGRLIKDSRFIVLEEINRGSMGIIYRARDKILEEIVALKILNDYLCSDPDAIERFKREARAAKRLSHPHIVRIHDMFESAGRMFISMEYIEGTDLKAMLRENKKFAWSEMNSYVVAICDALKYAHKLRIVHRDIKPANIMITSGDEVKITDFGIAKILSSEDMTRQDQMIMGTPLYMAPEQVEGGAIDFRTDIYTLGTMLFEMTAGQPPYHEGNIEYQHVHAEIPRLPDDVPQLLAETIYKCMAKKPDDRYQSISDLEKALRVVDQSGSS